MQGYDGNHLFNLCDLHSDHKNQGKGRFCETNLSSDFKNTFNVQKRLTHPDWNLAFADQCLNFSPRCGDIQVQTSDHTHEWFWVWTEVKRAWNFQQSTAFQSAVEVTLSFSNNSPDSVQNWALRFLSRSPSRLSDLHRKKDVMPQVQSDGAHVTPGSSSTGNESTSNSRFLLSHESYHTIGFDNSCLSQVVTESPCSLLYLPLQRVFSILMSAFWCCCLEAPCAPLWLSDTRSWSSPSLDLHFLSPEEGEKRKEQNTKLL